MSIEHLKRELAEAGLDITSRSVKAKLHAAHRQAQKETATKYRTGQKEKVTKRIQSMLAMLAVFFVAGFLVVGNIANLIMFPVSEFIAVRRGIMAFEAHGFIASFNAATMVVGYVVLLFVKNVLRDNLPGKDPGLTLRRSFSGLLYFLGVSKDNEELAATERMYISIRGTILFMQASIVLFGFLGRASDSLIEGGTVGIVEIIGYSGTLILTMALLAVTDITVLFIYSVFVNTVGVLNLTANDKNGAIDFLEERREYLQGEVLKDLLIMATVEQSSSLTE